MNIKELFIRFGYIYSYIPIEVLIKFSKIKRIYPFYHGVTDKDSEITNHLYKLKTKEEFKNDLEYILKHFKPLKTIHTTSFSLKGDKSLGCAFLLTFDDGLRSFYTEIVPILKEKRITAISFLNSDFINNKSLFFRYKINLIIFKIKNTSLSEIEKIKLKKVIGLNRFNEKAIIKELLVIKSKEIKRINEIGKIVGLDFKNKLNEIKPYMSTNEIKYLISNGFYIGAHSQSHPNFEILDLDNQLKETFNSIKFIQDEFNLGYKFFAFPFSDYGVNLTFFNEMNKNNIVTFGTAGILGGKSSSDIQRIPMEYKKKYSAERIIKGELLYFIIKNTISKFRDK